MTNREAINLISRNKSVFQFDPAMLEALDLAIKVLNRYTPLCPVDFPTEDDPYPVCSWKRPRGEWVEGTQGYFCSKCDYYDNQHYEHKYCPNCGADMRGKNNGN